MELLEEKYRAILDRLRTQCAKREYCQEDIRRKLAKELDAQAVDDIVEALVKDAYVDDARYARAFARDKSALAGWGPIKIRHALAAKDVSREDIASAMEGLEPGLEKLTKALEIKAKTLREDPHRKFKLLRFALGRGYEYEQIRGLVDEVLEGLG